MKAYKTEGGTIFHHAADLSESVLIVAADGTEVYIPGVDILEFVANYVRGHMIETLKNSSPDEILFGGSVDRS